MYILCMKDEVDIQSHWTVDETLQQKPENSFVFIKYRTQCVGCFLQRFCTIKDVVEIYQLDLEKFLKDLNDDKKGE
jgi:hybrid cluster-associated redox disulfide protein